MKFFSGQIGVLSIKISYAKKLSQKGGGLRRKKFAKQYLTGSQYIYHLKKKWEPCGFFIKLPQHKANRFSLTMLNARLSPGLTFANCMSMVRGPAWRVPAVELHGQWSGPSAGCI